jgi:ParB family chromosome partitioning protein
MTVLALLLFFSPFFALGMVLPGGPEHRRIPLARITVNPGQARKSFPQSEILRLAESLRVRGQLNPLIVRYDPGRDLYILSSGERRFRAMQHLGWEDAECKVLDREPDEADMLRESIEENIHRAELPPMQLARAIQRLQTLEGGTLASIAESLHISPAMATKTTAMLVLPPDVQALIDEGRISPRHGYAFSHLSDETYIRELAELAAAGKLTALQAEEAVQARAGKRQSKPRSGRVACKLGAASIAITGEALTVEGLLEALQTLLRRVRKAADQGHDMESLTQALRNGG